MEKPTALEAGIQKFGSKIWIWAVLERSTLRAISGAKIKFLTHFFLKHKLHLILSMIVQNSQRNVSFKGLKLALKNLVRFSSPTASGAILRGKYQHFGLNLLCKTSRSYNFVYSYEKKSRNLNFEESKLTREAKTPIFIAIIF